MERVNERLAYLSFGWGVRGVLGFRVFGWSGATNVFNELIHERDTVYHNRDRLLFNRKIRIILRIINE